MSVRFTTADPREMLSHYLLYGAAVICEAAGLTGVRISWSDGMDSRPELHLSGAGDEELGEVVLAHAGRMADEGSWLWRRAPHDQRRALMSPRLSAVGDERAAWERLQGARWATEDDLLTEGDLLSLSLVAALGEPSYWSFNRFPPRQRLQDHGASRLEMQPRNQGSEFVGTRLRGLATAVASRSAQQVVAGLVGRDVVDDMGKGASDSRTATNLRPPGPTDSAMAWVALWGLSQTTLLPQAEDRSRTATHTVTDDRPRREVFTLPLWRRRWTTAKLRSVLAGPDLSGAARRLVAPELGLDDTNELRAVRRRRGIEAVAQFPVSVFGSASAPERRVMSGRLTPLPE